MPNKERKFKEIEETERDWEMQWMSALIQSSKPSSEQKQGTLNVELLTESFQSRV